MEKHPFKFTYEEFDNHFISKYKNRSFNFFDLSYKYFLTLDNFYLMKNNGKFLFSIDFDKDGTVFIYKSISDVNDKLSRIVFIYNAYSDYFSYLHNSGYNDSEFDVKIEVNYILKDSSIEKKIIYNGKADLESFDIHLLYEENMARFEDHLDIKKIDFFEITFLNFIPIFKKRFYSKLRKKNDDQQ